MEKMALVPKLRFPEFHSTGKWQEYRLDEIADRITDKVGDKELTTLSISAGTGFVSQVEKFSRDISGKQYENYIHLRKGDFAYNKGNSKKFPQGCIYELNEYEEAAVPNVFIIFHFNDDYLSSFYKGYFENNFHGKQLTKFITSGARSDGLLNISPTDFFSIILPTPKEKEEQQKIAECLSSLDELITAEDKKLEALKAHKKGLMQKLFPAEGETVPEWRFPEFRGGGEWDESNFENFIKLYRGSSPRPIQNYLTKNNGVNWIKIGDTKNADGFKIRNVKEMITEEGAQKSRFVTSGELILANSMSYGKTYELELDGCIYDGWFVLREYEKHFHKKFLLQQLNSDYLQKQYTSLSAGGVVQNISSDIVYVTILKCPQLKEQQKIADFLSTVDELINAQAQKVKILRTHKKSLMQGLFAYIEEVSR